MAMKYTEEQLNKFDKATLVQLFLATQEQLESIDSKLQLVLEQLAVANSKRFGRSSEKMAPDNQMHPSLPYVLRCAVTATLSA